MSATCTTCGDTHRMGFGDREVPCTRCPTPCDECRVGAYCATVPCACGCHRMAPATATDLLLPSEIALLKGRVEALESQVREMRSAAWGMRRRP